MKQCDYCRAKPISQEITVHTWDGASKRDVVFGVCGAACEKQIRDFANFANRHAGKFFLGIAAGIVIPIIVVLVGAAMGSVLILRTGASLALLLIGLTLIMYPFATPQTNRAIGLRRAIGLVKTIGYVLVAGAVIVFFFVQ